MAFPATPRLLAREACQAVALKSIAPQLHGASRDAKVQRNLADGMALGQRENNPASSRHALRCRPRLRVPFEPSTIVIADANPTRLAGHPCAPDEKMGSIRP